MMHPKTRMKGLGVGDLSASALAVVVLIIVVAVGATVLQQVRSTQTVNNSDYNISSAGLAGLITYSNWFSIIVIIIVAVVIIGLLVRSFGQAAG